MILTLAITTDPIKLVIITMLLIMILIPAIILGAITFFLRSKDKARRKERWEQTQKQGPNPGSDADFERWKQERQNGGKEK